MRTDTQSLNNRPEYKNDVPGLLDGCTEPHNGQRADHAEGDGDVAADHNHDDDGNQENQHVSSVKPAVIADAAVGKAIGKENNQGNRQSKTHDQKNLLGCEAGGGGVKHLQNFSFAHCNLSYYSTAAVLPSPLAPEEFSATKVSANPSGAGPDFR